MSDLVEYYGTECTHCIQMQPMLEEVQKELNISIERKEVWHNAENQAEFMKVAEGKCQGVPFFINNKTGKFICGAASKEQVVAWAKGE